MKMEKKSLIIILSICAVAMIFVTAILLAVVWKSEGKTKCEKAEFGVIYSNADGVSKSFYSACFKGKLKEYYCSMGKLKYRLKNCGEGKVCEDGKCVAERENPEIISCVSDGECEDGKICISNLCVLQHECRLDDECAQGYVCKIGKCVINQNISFQSSLYDLELFSDGWPRGLADRSFTEYFLRWNKNFNNGQPFTEESYQVFSSRVPFYLDAINGKVLDEEVPDTFNDRGIEYFSEFKKRNPKKVVLLDFNGDARDPRFGGGNFSAGHWLYKPGCSVTQDIPESSEDTWIYVENPDLFKMNVGSNKEAQSGTAVLNTNMNCYNEKNANCSLNDELVICFKINNVIDWDYCEQVILLQKDTPNKRLLVKRNVFDFSPPKSFMANEAYIAPHTFSGPWWGNGLSNLVWRYNFATTCPKDEKGKVASDILADEFRNYFKKGGLLEYFDGVMLDVTWFTAKFGADVNVDGTMDGGFINGVNVYGIGMSEYIKKLRVAMGENKAIIPDAGTYGGGYPMSYIGSAQRAFGVVNSVDFEAWPAGQTSFFWSSAINEVLFWNANNANRPFTAQFRRMGEQPAILIGNINPINESGAIRWEFGIAIITDSYSTFGKRPYQSNDIYPFAEFFRNGNANWLGRPVGKIIRLAEKSTPMLRQSDQNFISKFSSDNALLSLESNKIKISPRGSASNEGPGITLSLNNLAVSGSDLVVYFNVSAEQWTGYPADIPRVVFVMVDGHLDLRNNKPLALETFANDKSFLAGFYFRDITSDSVNLTIAIEGNSSFYISDFRAYNAVDALAREYDNGAVLVNPSDEPYTFRLCEIFPNSCDKFETREIVVPGIDAALLEKK